MFHVKLKGKLMDHKDNRSLLLSVTSCIVLFYVVKHILGIFPELSKRNFKKGGKKYIPLI